MFVGMDSQQRRSQRSRSAEEPEKLSLPVKHNTRSQSGYPMKKKMRYSPSLEQEDDRLGELIEEGTQILATIDRASDNEELIKDAISLCDRVVFPMCFPWSHHVDTVGKVIPRDIDEMQCIAKLGSLEETFTALKKLEPVRLSACPSDMKSSSRRTEDIGAIELSLVRYRSMSQKRSDYLVRPPCPLDRKSGTSMKYPNRQYYDECDASVKLTILKSKEISLRLNSTSTRSTLFEREGPSVPLLLHALLSHGGHDTGGSENSSLQSVSRFLGSYDSNTSLTESSKQTSGKNYALSARNRLVWTERRHFQRPYFRSILSGEKLEGNSFQRPKSVRVGLRVNGKLLSTSDISAKIEVANLFTMLDNMPNHCPSYKDSVIGDALEEAFETRQSSFEAIGSNLLCSLSAEKLAKNVLDEIPSKLHIETSPSRERQLVDNVLRAYEAIGTTGKQTQYMVEPPILDCCSGEDGLIKVICTKPGKFADGMLDYSAVLNDSDQTLCIVCWAAVDPTLDEKSADEKFYIHALCRAEQGKFSGNDDKCFVCDKAGGYGVTWKGGWVHETCRIWSDPVAGQVEDRSESLCVFCGNVSRWVTKCVADGCLVCFHPMCAVLGSQAMAALVRQKENDMIDDPEVAQDVYLCTQFQLSTAKVRASVAVPSFQYSTELPIAFCGFHNRYRRSDYYGLYPGGMHLTNAVTIPWANDGDDALKS